MWSQIVSKNIIGRNQPQPALRYYPRNGLEILKNNTKDLKITDNQTDIQTFHIPKQMIHK
jgi:hypothetical protein